MDSIHTAGDAFQRAQDAVQLVMSYKLCTEREFGRFEKELATARLTVESQHLEYMRERAEWTDRMFSLTDRISKLEASVARTAQPTVCALCGSVNSANQSINHSSHVEFLSPGGASTQAVSSYPPEPVRMINNYVVGKGGGTVVLSTIIQDIVISELSTDGAISWLRGAKALKLAIQNSGNSEPLAQVCGSFTCFCDFMCVCLIVVYVSANYICQRTGW